MTPVFTGVRTGAVTATRTAVLTAILAAGLLATPAWADPSPGPPPGATTPVADRAAALDARLALLDARAHDVEQALARTHERLAALSTWGGLEDDLVAERLQRAQRAVALTAAAAYRNADPWDPAPPSRLEAAVRELEQARAAASASSAAAAATAGERVRLGRQLAAAQDGRTVVLADLARTRALLTDQLAVQLTAASRDGARAARRLLVRTPTAGAPTAALAAVRFALARTGSPYQWGAVGPDRFDCSGLMMTAYAAAGVALPRTAREQFWAGTPVARSALLPGDLVFFAFDPTDPTTIHHVGMVVADGFMVHAPHTGDVVRVSPIWQQGYAGAVRLVAAAPAAPVASPLAQVSAPTHVIPRSPTASPIPAPRRSSSPSPTPSPVRSVTASGAPSPLASDLPAGDPTPSSPQPVVTYRPVPSGPLVVDRP